MPCVGTWLNIICWLRYSSLLSKNWEIVNCMLPGLVYIWQFRQSCALMMSILTFDIWWHHLFNWNRYSMCSLLFLLTLYSRCILFILFSYFCLMNYSSFCFGSKYVNNLTLFGQLHFVLFCNGPSLSAVGCCFTSRNINASPFFPLQVCDFGPFCHFLSLR